MNKKIISIICATVLTLCAVVGGVVFTGMQTNASGTHLSVSVYSPSVEKVEVVKVLVTASSGESMSYIKADLSYDPEKLELVGTSTDLATGANGEIQIIETLAYGETERTYELTFKALEVGATDIRLYDAYIEQYESLEMLSLEGDSLEVGVNTAISEEARIKELMIAGVQKLEEKFSPDVYEYNVEVGVDMEMLIYSAVPMEEDSVVTAPEDLMLAIGENHFEILVTAPAGNTQTYVINVTRLDHELESETETETESALETGVESETETETETEPETESETLGEELLGEPQPYSYE